MDVLHAAGSALVVLFTPLRMGVLLGGVVLGLLAGVISGLGGIAALSLLLPFTFGMDPYSAMAILMGLAAAVSHGDVIPAVLFGVPGTVGCAATIMDGYPMAKRGEAGRALGAAFSSSLIGGVFGAIILAIIIPVISPVVLFFGSPELLSICVFGMTLAASLSGNAPLKGMAAAAAGLLLSMVGEDPLTGTQRLTFDLLYLWSGIPVVPVALGIFAIPELCDIMIRRTPITSETRIDAMRGQWQGWRDSFNNWFLVLRTAALGAVCAMAPGIGAPVIDWIAYGHAIKTEKGAARTFGSGDVRGVIAAESSTNAREGGSLVTTIAFGVPGQPSSAILLSAFLIQGIVPGPAMLTKHLALTYTIVWSLALANVFGTLICFAFANQFARIATVRSAILLPVVMTLVFMGALEGRHSWGDIVTLLALGTCAWVMKRCGWPRPPLILGFVLGRLIERYLFISVERYGWDWLTNWFVVLMFAASLLGLASQMWVASRGALLRRLRARLRRPIRPVHLVFAVAVLAVFSASLVLETQWSFTARLAPEVVSIFGIGFGVLIVFAEIFSADPVAPPPGTLIVDSRTDYGTLSSRQVSSRAVGYFGWTYGMALLAYLIGVLPALVLSAFLFPRGLAGERWRTAAAVGGGVFVLLWAVFDHLAHVPWPPSLIGDMFPALRASSHWF